MERLQADLGVTEPSALIALPHAKERHADVLSVYTSLPAGLAHSTKNAVLALRSRIVMGPAAAIDGFLATHDVNDAEFHLARASRAWARGDAKRTIAHVRSAETAPRALLTYDEPRRETSYLRALCATKSFDSWPSETTYKEALDKWRDVRAALSGNRAHPYYRKEREERSRLSRRFASIKEQL